MCEIFFLNDFTNYMSEKHLFKLHAHACCPRYTLPSARAAVRPCHNCFHIYIGTFVSMPKLGVLVFQPYVAPLVLCVHLHICFHAWPLVACSHLSSLIVFRPTLGALVSTLSPHLSCMLFPYPGYIPACMN